MICKVRRIFFPRNSVSTTDIKESGMVVTRVSGSSIEQYSCNASAMVSASGPWM